MSRSSFVLEIFILLLGFSLYTPVLLPAQGPPEVYVSRILLKDSNSQYRAEIAALNQRIDKLAKKLRTMSWPGLAQANYMLGETDVDDGGTGILALTANFVTPKTAPKGQKKTGRSKPASNLEDRIETALADLLHKTLLDPELGPFGFVRVEKCDIGKGEYVLTVRPPAHVTLDDGPAYELGRAKSNGGSRGLGIFFHAETVTPGAGGTTEVNFVNLKNFGNEEPESICTGVSKSSPLVLLVRYSIPKPAEGSNHGNAQRP